MKALRGKLAKIIMSCKEGRKQLTLFIKSKLTSSKIILPNGKVYIITSERREKDDTTK